MLKKGLSMILALIMLLSALYVIPVYAEEADDLVETGVDDYRSGDFTYRVIDGEARIMTYWGSASNLTIPSTIDGYPVVYIQGITANDAPKESLVSVTIPDSVTEIGYSAFYQCYNLRSITIPSSVKQIGGSAFCLCEKLTNVEIPNSVTKIGSSAFLNCNSLFSVTIPASVNEIGGSAFGECQTLSRIVVDDNNAVYDSRESCNAIIQTANNMLIQGCMYSSIPDSVTSIRRSSFEGCIGLAELDIPDSVTSIERYAFKDCTGLTSVSLSNSLKSLSYGSFINCTGLTQIEIPDSVSSIDDYAFSGCSNLKQISVPDTLSDIGSHAFEKTGWYNNQPDGLQYIGKVAYQYKGTCPSSLTLKKGTIGIAGSAFSGCSALTSINMPDTVTVIGKFAFSECTNLSQITLHDTLKKIGSLAFQNTAWYNSKPIGMIYIGTIAYKYKSSDDSKPVYPSVVTFESGTTSISGRAFYYSTIYNNDTIKQVIIPDTVTEIGERAFAKSIDLKEVTIPASVTSIGEYAFGYYMWYPDLVSNNEFIIRGYAGTEAQRYANDNGFTFIEITDSQPTEPPVNPTTPPTQPPVNPTDPAKVNIANCTVTLSQSSYTYDGTAKTPTVTVKDGSKTLSSSSDYSVSYSGNTNAGTATATVTGKGNYTGSTSKFFTINKASISGYTVTLSQSSYVYDGSAKKPTVTVKNGSKTLTSGTDYTVSYSNNTNVGTATATVTGKGNYSGTASKTFTITVAKSKFEWGKDNWNFINTASHFSTKSYGSFKYSDLINSTYSDKLKKNLSNTEYQRVFGSSGYINSTWGGSCYGMAVLNLMAKDGKIPYTTYKSGAANLYSLNKPVNDKKVNSLITYYHMLQKKDVVQQLNYKYYNKSNEQIIKELISLLDTNPEVLVCFYTTSWGHAIVATGYEYGSWTYNGITYQGCIKICDPNNSTSYDKDFNIYFNTKTYNWAIPEYYWDGGSSTKGAEFGFICADTSILNTGGYHNASSYGDASGPEYDEESFVARIDAYTISDNRHVSKVRYDGGQYANSYTAPGDIEEDNSYVFAGESSATAGYNLFDAQSAYRVTQDDHIEMDLSLNYGSCYLTGGSLAGESVLFDKDGVVQVKGESADYNLSMTFNDSYPTDWFTIAVSGSNADNVTLRKAEDGYILSCDNLENVQIDCNNKEVAATASFSTGYDSVFVYEVNQRTIGLKVDADRNGTYETAMKLLGDTDGNQMVETIDATYIQRSLADEEVPFTKQQMILGDVDNSGDLEVMDVTAIQYYLAKLKHDDKIGKFFD